MTEVTHHQLNGSGDTKNALLLPRHVYGFNSSIVVPLFPVLPLAAWICLKKSLKIDFVISKIETNDR